MLRDRFKQVAIVMCGLVCILSTARATTFVLMDEPTLLHTSSAVLVGTVTAIESAASDPSGTINTYVHIQPHRILKGRLDRRQTLVLREPGGTVGERRQWIFGAPEFWVGERALLFLTRNADGTLQTNSLSMGKFTLAVDADGHTIAVRHFGYGASVMVPENGEILEAQPQSQRFVSLLSRLRTLAVHDTAGTMQPVTLTPTELATTPTVYHDAFTYLSNPPARWFQPDSGQAVNYVIDSKGDAKLGFATSRAAVDSAFAAWTNVPTSSLILGDGGTADCTIPANCTFGPCDANRIVFNDPNSEITDPSGCSGILAIGGYCSGGGTKVVNGTSFGQITVGKVTFNNGWSACSFWNQCNMAEVATHEIGHTIGLGHSTDSTATMAAVAHFDGRCAGLAADDVAAVNYIYPQVGTPPPTATFTHTPTITNTRTVTWTPTRTPTRTMTPTATRTFTPGAPTATFTPGLPPAPPPTAAPTATSPAGESNDTCAGAATITTWPYNGIATTTAATIDSTDPFPSCGNGSRGRSVWYGFTAPSSGPLTVNTFGSTYDTILTAYTGSCGAFSAVSGGCNDDASGTAQSQVSLTATAGTTYYFMVTSYNNVGGTVHFQLTFQGSGNTATPRPPTATFTPAPPTATATAVPPTATFTQTRPPTATFTAAPATATFTAAPPTLTFTPAPPTATFTAAPPTATFTSTPMPTATSAGGFSNDLCVNAADITVTPYSSSVTTTTASIDSSDPFPPCGNGSRGRSVWYRFTAPSSGPLTVNSFGSTYDTILTAYTGSCGAFSAVRGGCNDDASGTAQSQVSITATAGMTYYFMVTSYNNIGGTVHFQLTFQGSGNVGTPRPPTVTSTPAPPTATPTPAPPTAIFTQTPPPTATFTAAPPAATFTAAPPTLTFTAAAPTATFTAAPPTATFTHAPVPTATTAGGFSNDLCVNAASITVTPYGGAVNTSTASVDTNDPFPSCGNGSRGRSVWYRFTAPRTGPLTASTSGSGYDTILTAYTGACGAFSAVSGACNDDFGGTAQSQVSFTATAGTTYYFMVSAYSNNGGALVFRLTF